MDHCSCWH